MVFTHANIITPYDINTIEGDFGRRYVTPNGSYPSITTVLGDKEKPWLIDWRESMGEEAADAEMARAAARGTAVHLMAEHYLQNKPNVCDGHLKEHADDFRKMRLMLIKSATYMHKKPHCGVILFA